MQATSEVNFKNIFFEAIVVTANVPLTARK
jgi:hypothetical protein